MTDSKPTPVTTDKKEIERTLNSVIAGKNLVHVSGLHSRELLTSALLGLDCQNEFLYLDCSQNKATNRKLLADRIVGCMTTQAGVRIEFPGYLTDIRSFRGGRAFISQLPRALTKLQRREFFRLALGKASNVSCKLFGNNVPAGRVLNLSLGGLAVEFDAQSNTLPFISGQLYARGVVVIPGIPSFSVDLIARFSGPNAATPEKLRVGFEFVSLPGAVEAALQKYITNQERKALSL